MEGNGGDDQFTVGNGDLIANPLAGHGRRRCWQRFARGERFHAHRRCRLRGRRTTAVSICTSPGPPPVDVNIALFDLTADKLENVRLNATQGINRFDVTPNADTALFIDGNEPHVVPGDYLSIRFDGTTGPKLTITNQTTGTGMWEFTNRKTVMFDHIERFNYFPILVYGAEAAAHGKPTVKVVDAGYRARS